MATAPVKSQPLHNFDLPHLRWAHKNNNNHHSSSSSSPHSTTNSASHNRFRRRDSPDLHNHGVGGGVGGNSNSANNNNNSINTDGCNTVASLSPFNTSGTDLVPVLDDSSAQVSKSHSRTPRKPFSLSSSGSPQKDASAAAVTASGGLEKDDVVEEGESEAKPWNLRPRKVVTFPTTSFKKGDRMLDETIFYQKKDNSTTGGNGHPKSSRLRGEGFGHDSIYGSDRPRKVEEKMRLWISLSREEIEEDVYALTGSRPARKAKKRPKVVQKQLDNVFPGLYLVGMTVDAYRVHDSLR